MIVSGRDVFGKTYKIEAGDLEWRPSIYGLVIKDGKLLMSHQFGDKYDLPGGGIELGEQMTEAVVREVREETGIETRPMKLLDVAESFFVWPDPEKQYNYHSILIYYLCEYVGGEFSIDGIEEAEKDYMGMPEWVPLEKVSGLKRASTHDFREVIELATREVTA